MTFGLNLKSFPIPPKQDGYNQNEKAQKQTAENQTQNKPKKTKKELLTTPFNGIHRVRD